MNRFFKLKIFLIVGLILNFSSCKANDMEDKLTERLYFESLDNAKNSNQLLLVVFKADWCSDCNSLVQRFMQNAEINSLLNENFLIYYVDIGRFDKNLVFAERFGSPEKKGIPALVIVDPSKEEKVLATTMGGEFSEAQQMQDKEIFNYLKQFVGKK